MQEKEASLDDLILTKQTPKVNYQWDLNKTSVYLRPMVGPEFKHYYAKTNYLNTYCSENRMLYSIFMKNSVYKSKRFEQDCFDKLELKFEYDPNYRGTIENDVFVTFISQFPEKHEDDFDKIVSTKYSETSQPYKKKVLNFYSDNASVMTYVAKRLHPTDEDLMDLADSLDTPFENVKISGQIESYFDMDKERYSGVNFSEGGVIYEYIKNGGKI